MDLIFELLKNINVIIPLNLIKNFTILFQFNDNRNCFLPTLNNLIIFLLSKVYKWIANILK